MVEEFLSVLVDGREPKGGLPAALDADTSVSGPPALWITMYAPVGTLSAPTSTFSIVRSGVGFLNGLANAANTSTPTQNSTTNTGARRRIRV